MKMLVLGGTVFLGRAVARQARDAGHDVVCAARGSSGRPVGGVQFVRVDRDDPAGLDALDGTFDAVVDVGRRPSHVRHAVEALRGRVGHFTFVSSGSVYADTATPGQTVADAPVMAPAPQGFDDPFADAEAYGRCKVTCEQLVASAADRVFICRAGLIVGPEDPTGRFDYWVRRTARGGEILAPGEPEDLVQFIDVRDLAGWIVRAAERGLAGVFDGIGTPLTRREFHAGLAEGAPSVHTLTWVPQSFLTVREVAPWSGPRSLPLWLPLPEYGGFLSRDASLSIEAGLRVRPLRETVRDTLSGLSEVSHNTGLSGEEEAELLREWRSR
ncbi:NAD-dependent epimerase/dehydratase family protein [Dactylosporangium roseum]|uniref:NAD-dependent epimerase/dehydratase family protein n=1 Tax=Dactylosporangium roseum TaxID=47989 RepID=A0ABY5Z795_9ACTN|nr:NAD-dependent epimerase/dehydratase family protein [Dactylosporangium roseum]UWZ37712.1 NAD-dependent epimerase/dehydratase family protein [Dactylosporangium roseum]